VWTACQSLPLRWRRCAPASVAARPIRQGASSQPERPPVARCAPHPARRIAPVTSGSCRRPWDRVHLLRTGVRIMAEIEPPEEPIPRSGTPADTGTPSATPSDGAGGSSPGCMFAGMALANMVVVGFAILGVMLGHFDCAPSCDLSVDWIIGSGCATCTRRAVSTEDVLIALVFFFTGVVWGVYGLGGWSGAALALLGQFSIVAPLLIVAALVRTAQGEPRALVAALLTISLPSLVGWALARWATRGRPSRGYT
jgi:hypothetical protein